jgi:thiamine pyrophosphate-dependent acetolactate synthase large subunit-like protein
VGANHTVLDEESPSNLSALHTAWPILEPDTFYTFASEGLGWNLPASVGIALGERDRGRNRPVMTIIGDGSFQLFGSINLESRATTSSAADCCYAQRGILHSQIVC